MFSFKQYITMGNHVSISSDGNDIVAFPQYTNFECSRCYEVCFFGNECDRQQKYG